MWLLLCWSHRLHVVCVCMCGEGELLVMLHWKSCCEHWKSFCNMLVTSGDFVTSSCHYLIIISVISSICISSLVVLNGWRRRRHGAFYNFFDVHAELAKIVGPVSPDRQNCVRADSVVNCTSPNVWHENFSLRSDRPNDIVSPQDKKPDRNIPFIICLLSFTLHWFSAHC